MSTFLAKPNEVERNWYVIDAAGKSLGRVAAQAATLLRGTESKVKMQLSRTKEKLRIYLEKCGHTLPHWKRWNACIVWITVEVNQSS